MANQLLMRLVWIKAIPPNQIKANGKQSSLTHWSVLCGFCATVVQLFFKCFQSYTTHSKARDGFIKMGTLNLFFRFDVGFTAERLRRF